MQEHARFIDHADAVQQGELVRLIEKAALTRIGRKYDFSSIRTYRQFASTLPLYSYEDLRPQIMRMVNGIKDELWPGRCMNFAQSSGTSDGRSKYIPITRESFRWNHYVGASDVVSHYLNLNPTSRIFSGKAFILGGSFANNLKLKPGVRVGDLSANLIENMNPLANLARIPSKQVALMEDWAEKLPQLVEASIGANVTNLSGVPSWFLTVLREVLQRTGKSCIHEVWPNLEVFFHGGIAFEPYRQQYEQLCDMSKMHFLDTYNASEGFFAVQSDWSSEAMLLLLDVGVFYEFLPVEDCDSETPEVYPIWEIEAGRTYELIITAANGLWRYRLGDTVTIEQLNPVKITIAGRTRSFINAFGEELMVHNADHAIALAEKETGSEVLNYTAPRRRREAKSSTILQHRYMHMMANAVTTSGLSSLSASPPTRNDSCSCWTSICAKSIATMMPSARATSSWHRPRWLSLPQACLTNGSLPQVNWAASARSPA